MPDTLRRRAYAKLNLMLSVGPAAPPGAAHPGWHPIASWMAAIALWDEVEIERLPEGTPSAYAVAWAEDAPRPTPIDWPIDKDLAVRAHRLLEAEFGRALPVRVEVRKRIPVGGGLGGGSSDAAAALAGVAELFDLPMERVNLLAPRLGSDVAFFFDVDNPDEPPRSALVTGFGDELERLDPISGEVILIIPPYPCATPAVYAAYDGVLAERERERAAEWRAAADARRARGGAEGRPPEPHAPKEALIRDRVRKMAGELAGRGLFNDLAVAAYRVEPRLGELALSISKMTREEVHVTGSGSCLFIVPERMSKTMERLGKAEMAGVKVMVVTLA